MLVSVAEQRVYKVWLVQKNGYQLDGYFEAADDRLPEPDDVIEVKSLSGGSHRAKVTSFKAGGDPPIQASELDES
jgi:hypothetical protein